MKRSLFTGFLFLPLGISVHICTEINGCQASDEYSACLLDVLQNLLEQRLDTFSEHSLTAYHVAVSVECLHTSEELLVVSQRNEDLCMIPNSLLQH